MSGDGDLDEPAGGLSQAPPGSLVLVATPIGNLGDLSVRAVRELDAADAIACEDSRRTGRLLQHAGVRHARLLVVNDHTEAAMVDEVLARLARRERVAVVTDAGTPGIADPGERLVRAAIAAGHPVVVVPGPSAVVAALVTSGLPTGRFVFEGFLPRKGEARAERLRELATERRTIVCYEAPHRVARTLADLAGALGPARRVAVARELTKRYESVRRAGLGALAAHFAASEEERRGEFVVLVQGAEAPDAGAGADAGAERVLRLLLAELPLGRAVALAAKITGARRNVLYARALELSGDGASGA